MLLLLSRHLIWSGSDGRGGTITYYYYDAITWIAAALLAGWIIWMIVRSVRRARAMRRPSRRIHQRPLKRVVRRKRQLTSIYLRPGFSGNIHAVGVGRLPGNGEYCIQVFVNNAGNELWAGAGAQGLPVSYRGVPLTLIEMPAAGFLSAPAPSTNNGRHQSKAIRDLQEVIVGGISGAHTNLSGQTGTIGYLCTRRSRLLRRKETYLLSNTHVFADLLKPAIDEHDLILQPSPGESGSNRPIASLVNFSPVKLGGDLKTANRIDAAIAKLWGTQQHRSLIPMIGAVKGYAGSADVEIGEAARKFGRTTGYTEGRVFSLYLDIWIRYDRTGQSAFFKDQILIEPASPQFPKFVSKGDSGSLVVDAKQHAIGLICAGMTGLPDASATNPQSGGELAALRIENYGVANPISDVLNGLKIDLVTEQGTS
ncbi:MAG TPA: hypothetical protein VGN86_13540 [Pyrinomonadaceae bacterium]|nr:hypothetical protein [Pyrinomonadaceae bacterium]